MSTIRKPIIAVEVSAAAFIGPTAKGPTVAAKKALRRFQSFADFERIHGGVAPLRGSPNFIALAARAFFAEGGRALYIGRITAPTPEQFELALAKLETVRDIGVVAGPGCAALPAVPRDTMNAALVSHAERQRRFAVLDVEPGAQLIDARVTRARFDSKDAALYYPWVVVRAAAGAGLAESTVPPSGFICGVFARVDAERGVHKAPANEPLKTAERLERSISTAEQETLNPLGINCLRSFAGRGHVVWGARTTSSDAEWKYINVRRYSTMLRLSCERGLKWVASRRNAEPLWRDVRAAVETFLVAQWRAGALSGRRPEEAFFVRCDRSTMTQNDIDVGRLLCLVGIAVMRPAEFIMLRIEQSARP